MAAGTATALDADEIIARLDLRPHPEGGHYRETWRAPAAAGERASGTAIHFLLKRGERSRRHRLDATEIWHWYAGSALELHVSRDDGNVSTLILGPKLEAGQSPQIVVPTNVWQSAVSLGAWTLVGCTVSPGFEFSGFEMAPDDREPGVSA